MDPGPAERSARVLVVTGTGTEIGKTHISAALLHAIRLRGRRTAGLKPVETGVTADAVTDAERLAAASTFHVTHPAYAFPAPISPHLAARDAGAPPIPIDGIRDFVARAAGEVDLVLVELAGGLFTPVSDTVFNADIAAALTPDATILVAPDRLGVLHDVVTALRGASTVPLPIAAIALSATETTDASTGRNAPELRRLLPGLPVFELPRAPPEALATHPSVASLLDALASRLTPR
jgi:dethiobiotin synthetase